MSVGELAPQFGIMKATWTPVENQTSLSSNSGETTILELGEPYWEIDIEVEISGETHFDVWNTFLLRRRLQANSFLIHRAVKARPRDTSIVSDVGLTLGAISEANSTLTLFSWGSGKKAYPGDMISYRTAGNGYWIGQVTAEATGDIDGGITVSVWPRPRAMNAVQEDRLPRRIQALGEFRLSDQPRIREAHKSWDVKFKARQVIR